MNCRRCGEQVAGLSQVRLCPACLMAQICHTTIDEAWVRDRFPQLDEPVPLRETPEPEGDGSVRGCVSFAATDFESGEPILLHVIPPGVGLPRGEDPILSGLEKRAHLDHPRINRIRDHGVIDGRPYVIEDRPEGQPFGEAIREGKVGRADMLRLLPEISEAVGFAAQRGVPLPSEPDTVWIGPNGEITLTGLLSRSDGQEASPGRWLEEHPAVGTRIGNFRLEELIGVGGFAEVYRARQERPVRREVALKILKLGMDTPQVLARFQRERQALAQMTHSGIATIHDAGATDTGRPFIAMELVEGKPITAYCDANHLALKERARLLAQVCRAVDHAHGKGVIHRDLKPSNILVAEEDGNPVPRVIDFGIARALGEPLAAYTFFTRSQQFVGSPSYMAPEQVDGNEEIDAPSDVYQLGCVLYELLVGEPPLASADLESRGLREIIDCIQRQPVIHPADRLAGMPSEDQTELARRRATEPASLRSDLNAGGLPDVALQALTKNKANRYPTAAAMADDLDSWVERGVVRAPHRRRRIARLATRALVLTAALGLAGTIAYHVLPSVFPSPQGSAEEIPEYLQRRPAVSRAEDGSLRPVALFQLDEDLKSAIPGGPDMEVTGDPELAFETAEIDGREARVLHFPRFGPDEWLKVRNVIGVNGPPDATECNRWTLVYDIMFPDLSGDIALFQCHSENVGEAEMYLARGGITGRYNMMYGLIREGEWNRLVIAGSDNGRAQTYTIYLNGARLGIPWNKGLHSAGYAFDDEFLILCDGDQKTAAGYLGSFAIYDVPLTDAEVHALGGPDAAGIPPVLRPGPAVAETGGLPAENKKTVSFGERFGYVVAMRPGEAWVASPYSDVGATDTGSVHRYRQNEAGKWRYVDRVAVPPGKSAHAYFGSAMAMNDSLAVVGAKSLRGRGAIHLYRHDGDRWSAPERLEPAEPDGVTQFGSSLALGSGFVAAGARAEAGGRLLHGTVLMFDADSGRGLATLTADQPEPGDAFGAALAAWGDWLAVGAPGSEEVDCGPVSIYRREADGGWMPIARLHPGPGRGRFGKALAFSPDGSRLAAAADGAVEIFSVSDGSDWTGRSILEIPEEGADSAVRASFADALSFASPSRLLVGSPESRRMGRRTGVVFLFDERAGGTWERTRAIYPVDGTDAARFGSAISARAGLAWIGSPDDHFHMTSGGAAYPIILPEFEAQRFPVEKPFYDQAPDVAIDGDVAVAGSPTSDIRVRNGRLSIFRRGESGAWAADHPPEDPLPTGEPYHVERVALGGGWLGAALNYRQQGFYNLERRSWVIREAVPQVVCLSMDDHQVLAVGSDETINTIEMDGSSLLELTPLEWSADGFVRAASIHDGLALFKRDSLPEICAFRRVDGQWRQQFRLPAPDDLPPGARMAYVGEGLDHDGARAIVGTSKLIHERTGTGSGGAFVYDLVDPSAPPEFLACPAESEMPATGWSVAIRGDVALVGNPYVSRGLAPGRVYLYRRDSASGAWRFGTTLQAGNAEPGDEFGICLALDGGWAIVGAKTAWVYFFRVE